jgi:tetratricopeptide (TPR) repeat protein
MTMPRQHARVVMVNRFLSVGLFAACSAAAGQAPSHNLPSKGSTLQSLYDAPRQSQKAGDLSHAEINYRVFLAEAIDELASSHAQIGDYARAEALFDEALRLDPDAPALERDYATAALGAGDLKCAETLARGLLNDF